MKITVTLIQVAKRIQVSGNSLFVPVSLVVKDVKKGEIHVEQRKDQKRKILVDLIVLTLGQKKEKSFEKSWTWKGAGQEEGEGSKRNSCEPMTTEGHSKCG